ncbi:MAG: ABC transporter permease [Deltaproteobacteria bacterium]|nr:ABC transporter permease [Deltaproteobacteria bacterium]
MNLYRLLRLAWRNLWRNRRRTLITMTTIALGFAMAVFFIGLGDGGHNQMIRSAINMGEGHLTVQPRGYLESPANAKVLPDSVSLLTKLQHAGIPGTLSPRLALQVLASTAANSVGAVLEGLHVEQDPHVKDFRNRLVQGAWLAPGDTQGLAIGQRMAEKLKVRIGSKIIMMAGGDQGEVESRLGRVRAIYRTGLTELDAFMIISSQEFAQALLPATVRREGLQPITRLAIYLEQEDDLEPVKARLAALSLPDGAQLLDWREMMPQVVNFVIADDMGNYIWLVFILVMVTFGILNTILMSALERTREFGLLRALGLGRRHLLSLVLLETLLLALVSLALGWAVGGSLHAWFAIQGLDLSSMYPEGLESGGMFMEPVLYSELSWTRVWALSGIVFFTTLISGIYPAIKAARVPPVAALQT